MAIKCCKGCVPPKRTPTCHSTCEEYLKEKAKWEEEKKAIKANMDKTPNVSTFDFDKICYAGCGRGRRKR